MEIELTLRPFLADRPASSPAVPEKAARAAFELEWHAPLRLPAGAGTEIRCDRGAVWITQDYVSRDVVLEAGQRFVLDGDQAVLVQALEEAAISVAAPSASSQTRSASTAETKPGGRG